MGLGHRPRSVRLRLRGSNGGRACGAPSNPPPRRSPLLLHRCLRTGSPDDESWRARTSGRAIALGLAAAAVAAAAPAGLVYGLAALVGLIRNRVSSGAGRPPTEYRPHARRLGREHRLEHDPEAITMFGGPALGGLVLAATSTSVVFAVSAAAFVLVRSPRERYLGSSRPSRRLPSEGRPLSARCARRLPHGPGRPTRPAHRQPLRCADARCRRAATCSSSSQRSSCSISVNQASGTCTRPSGLADSSAQPRLSRSSEGGGSPSPSAWACSPQNSRLH